jgi:hypothetical protein
MVGDQTLRQAVRAVLLTRDPAFDRRRTVHALVQQALLTSGEFCRTHDGQLYFFSRTERRLYDLAQRSFGHLVTSLSGLSATEYWYRFLLDLLQAECARDAPLAKVHTLASYDLATGVLAMSDGASGVWLREPGGEWLFTHNGDGGLLFL